jgi:SPP1 family predicted phage head-tail adaptor
MNFGRFRHRITIQSVSLVKDGFGDVTENWADFATVWAAVDPIAGAEWFDGKTSGATTTTRFRIRYLSGLLPTMRIVFNGRYFNFDGPPQNIRERNEEIVIMATEVLAG